MIDYQPIPHDPLTARARRVRALVLKETRQVVRDPSSIAIGVVLPLVLILLFGYGLSLDVTNVPVAVGSASRRRKAASASLFSLNTIITSPS